MIMPVPTPIMVPKIRFPVMAAPKKPAKALISICPSMPMLMMPLRSQMMPTMAARISGTAYLKEKDNTETVRFSSKTKATTIPARMAMVRV